MSKETGSIPFLPQRSTPSVVSRSRGDFVVRIVELPQALASNVKLQHVAAQIVDQPDEQTLILKTEHGDVKVQTKDASQFPKGTQINLDLPAGHPPRQATIKGLEKQTSTEVREQIREHKPQVNSSVRNDAPTQTNSRGLSGNIAGQSLSVEDLEILQRSRESAAAQSRTKNSSQLKAGEALKAEPLQNSELRGLLSRIASAPLPVLSAPAYPNVASASLPSSALTQGLGQVFASFLGSSSAAYQSGFAALSGQGGVTNMPLSLSFFGAADQIHVSGAAQGALKTGGMAGIAKGGSFSGILVGSQSGGHVQFSTSLTGSTGLAQAGTGQSFLFGLPLGSSLSSAGQILGLGNSFAGQVSALVTGHTQNGNPILNFQPSALHRGGAENLVLNRPAAHLNVGSVLQFVPGNDAQFSQNLSGGQNAQWLGQIGAAMGASMSAYQSGGSIAPMMSNWSDFLSLGLWSSFQQLQAQASKSPYANVRASLANILPNKGGPSQMSQAMLLFLAAAKSGDIDNFLGKDLVQWLRQQGQGKLLDGLRSELGHLARLSADNVSGDWKAISFPYYADGQIDKIRMFYRRQGSGDDSEESEKSGGLTRFVLDLDLSQMGNVQIDGLIRDKRLDLILRTRQPFSEAVRQVLRQKYTGALELGEFSGELHFHGSAEQWVHIYADEQHYGGEV